MTQASSAPKVDERGERVNAKMTAGVMFWSFVGEIVEPHTQDQREL